MAVIRVGLQLANAHLLRSLTHHNAVAGPEAETIPDRLRDDNLALGAQLVRGFGASHTRSITESAERTLRDVAL